MVGQAPFIHPGLAAAALATGLIPVAIHFLNRRRYVRVPWAAMSFLLAANRKSKRRVRFEQWLLMLSRMAVILLLGAAVARPYMPQSSFLPIAASRSHHIVVIDNSLSMCARDDGVSPRFDQAREWLDRLLVALPATDAVSVVTLAAPATPLIADASFDRRFVRESLGSLVCTESAGDVAGGLEHAREILRQSESAPGNRFIYFVSDLPRQDWVARAAGEPTPAVVAFRKLADELKDPVRQLSVVRMSKEGAETVAVSSLAFDSSLIGVGVPLSVTAEVTNYGPRAVRGRTLEVRRGEQVIRRETIGTLEPSAKATVSLSTEFDSPGSHVVQARVTSTTPDSLPQDDRRFVSVNVPDTVRVLLIDGEPGASSLAGQAGFLAAALSPSSILGPTEPMPRSREERAFTPVTVRITTDADLVGDALPEYAVVALCNVQRLSEEQWRLLDRFVWRGGGLAVFAGGLVSGENYNRFGYAGGHGLLPGTFGRTSVDARGSSATGRADEPLGFKLEPVPHTIVSEFANLPLSGLFVARVMQYLPFEPDPNRAEIVLRYTDNQPALVASRYGAGHVVLCTTTANMDWTNLPAKGDYVSIMVGIVSFLSPRTDATRNITVGQVVKESVTAAQASLPMQVLLPDGKSAIPVVEPSGDGLLIRFGPVEHSGILRLTIGSEVRDYAVNVDPAESGLVPVDGPGFSAAIDRPVRFMTADDSVAVAAASPNAAELARAGFMGVIGLLVVEMLLAVRFGRQRT